MIRNVIVSNHESNYMIIFNKAYDLDYIKFVVNNSVENKRSIEEIVDTIRYNFDVEDCFNLENVEKVWCI